MAVGKGPAKAGRPLAAPRPTAPEAVLAAITTPAHLAGPLPLCARGNKPSSVTVQVVFFFYFLLKVGYENQCLAKETGDPMPFLSKYCCSILLYFRLAVY